MSIRIVLAAAALLASGSAFAQAAGTDQTTEDLVCQLSEKCTDEAQTPADAAPAATAPGAPRVSATRGFSIARKNPAPATTTSGARLAKPKALGSSAKRAQVAPAGKARASSGTMAMGRADLRVSFVTGSAELTAAGQREAQKFVGALSNPLLDGMRFTIEGHTDAVGGREYNLDLSRRRAQAVVDYLAGKGADRSRFDVAGYGFDKPLAGTSASAAANRRVEVVRIK
ncbi:MAG TPA: OmpA family protein [Novosphingobium sp.]|nr:OmpA family protein [Novosphingobium sp.]